MPLRGDAITVRHLQTHSVVARHSSRIARRAQAAYERALAIRPSLLDAQMFLANLLVDTGKVEQAVPLLRDALKTNGNYAAAHWELGYAYRFAGMLDESVRSARGRANSIPSSRPTARC